MEAAQLNVSGCLRVLRSVVNNKNSWPFLTPVDPELLNIQDYFKVITNPMDLGTVEVYLIG